jgi:hypothetical protein
MDTPEPPEEMPEGHIPEHRAYRELVELMEWFIIECEQFEAKTNDRSRSP